MTRPFLSSSYHNPTKLRRAFGEEVKSARIHTRFPCDFSGSLWTENGRTRLGAVRVLNIGMGGAGLKGIVEVEKGPVYILQLVRGRAQLLLDGKIVRLAREKGNEAVLHIGFSFHLKPDQEKRLKDGLEKMRRSREKTTRAEDSRLKWYWGV